MSQTFLRSAVTGRLARTLDPAYFEQAQIARCLFCPDWSFSGTANECLAEQKKHQRSRAHQVARRAAGTAVKRASNPKPVHLLHGAGARSADPGDLAA